MRRFTYFATGLLVLAGAGCAWGQSASCPTGTSATTSSIGVTCTPSAGSGGIAGGQSAIGQDQASTLGFAPETSPGIPQPSIPEGMTPLDVPDDPLGQATGTNPIDGERAGGGLQSFASHGISIPRVR